jgi:sterol desaturase/sphingolipid hydroxylase (fatty acid hydroxylase superfamily)
LNDFAAKALRYLTSDVAIRQYVLLVALFFLTMIIDGARRRSTKRYFSKSAANDLGYFSFFYLGPFQLMMIPIFTPMSVFVGHYAPWMQVNLIAALPVIPRLVVFLLLSDFLGYWIHRLTHAVPTLWAFHKVHHSQEAMTVLTNYRRHPVDELVMRLISFWVFVVTGNAVMTWALLDVSANVILLLQHSGLTWTYGKAERVFISPRMHGLHHSVDPAHFNRNFGMLFSIWDRMFGTAIAEGTVTVTGVTPPMPESLWRQSIDPFRELAQQRRTSRAALIAAEPGSAR